MEYGLGIFISGIDRGSLSEQSGLTIGDQILSVNGQDFRQITHQDAVRTLREQSRLVVHIRQMKKLPQPKSRQENPFDQINDDEQRKTLEHFFDLYRDEKINVEQFLRSLFEHLPEQQRRVRRTQSDGSERCVVF